MRQLIRKRILQPNKRSRLKQKSQKLFDNYPKLSISSRKHLRKNTKERQVILCQQLKRIKMKGKTIRKIRSRRFRIFWRITGIRSPREEEDIQLIRLGLSWLRIRSKRETRCFILVRTHLSSSTLTLITFNHSQNQMKVDPIRALRSPMKTLLQKALMMKRIQKFQMRNYQHHQHLVSSRGIRSNFRRSNRRMRKRWAAKRKDDYIFW